MTLIAVAVLTLSGGTIDARPQPPPPDPIVEILPLITTWYNPELGGINCAGDCATFGSGEIIQDYHYNHSAACLTRWRGRVLEIPGFGSFHCRDSGGAIGVRWTPEDGLHVRADILSREPIQRGPWTEWRLLSEEDFLAQ